MNFEQKSTVLQTIFTIFASILAIFLISDEQVAIILGISKNDLVNPLILLTRLGIVFRVSLIPFIVLIILAIFNLIHKANSSNKNEYSNKPEFSTASSTPDKQTLELVAKPILTETEAVQSVIDYISHHEDIQNIYIWGYSLNWAAKVSLVLRENRHTKLNVKVFLPSQEIIGTKFKVEQSDDRKAVLRIRISEWKKLVELKMISSLICFTHHLIPSDLGIILDDRLMIMSSYDWEAKGNNLYHVSQPIHARKYLQIKGESNFEKLLITHYKRRFLCREFDAEQIENIVDR